MCLKSNHHDEGGGHVIFKVPEEGPRYIFGVGWGTSLVSLVGVYKNTTIVTYFSVKQSESFSSIDQRIRRAPSSVVCIHTNYLLS